MQRSLSQKISQFSLSERDLFAASRSIFDEKKTVAFLNAVARNARIRFFGLLFEFINGVSAISEEVLDIEQVDERTINKIVNRKFYGTTIEEKFATLQAATAQGATQIFKDGLKAGLAYRVIERQIRQAFSVGGYKLERIVRTEGQRVSNDILFATYERNKKYLGGMQYLATLDKRTCETCASYDRSEYWYEGSPNVSRAPATPLHPFCRCIYTPISKEWRQNKRTRASMYGPVDKDYKEWLKMAEGADPGFAKQILGKNYDSWKAGQYEVSAKFTPQITYRNFLGKGILK